MGALIDEHFDFVWRSLRRLGVREAEVEDAAQEVLLVAARRLDQILPDRERAFLFGSALRVASTWRRSARRHPEDLTATIEDREAPDLDPEELSQLSRARPLLQEILDDMDAPLRQVFILSELEELTAPAVAGILDIPVGTVHSRLLRARSTFEKAAQRLRARDPFLGSHK